MLARARVRRAAARSPRPGRKRGRHRALGRRPGPAGGRRLPPATTRRRRRPDRRHRLLHRRRDVAPRRRQSDSIRAVVSEGAGERVGETDVSGIARIPGRPVAGRDDGRHDHLLQPHAPSHRSSTASAPSLHARSCSSMPTPASAARAPGNRSTSRPPANRRDLEGPRGRPHRRHRRRTPRVRATRRGLLRRRAPATDNSLERNRK